MACVAVTSLMRTIELEFLQSNPRLALKNREHIKSLHEKLGFLQMFLEESEKKADNCEDLIAKIRRVVSKAEYDIEAEVAGIRRLQTMDRTLSGVLEDVEQLMEMTKNAHNHDLAKDFQKIQHLGSLSSSPGSQSSSSQHYTSKFEDTMVGHYKEFEEFKDLLLPLSNNEPRKVMAVVGMGGIGKTTFARRIFHDCAVRSYFDCCGWVTITEEHNKRQVLLDLCCSVMPVMRDDFKTRTDDQLAEQLQKSLKGRRYLIVVDDIWSTDAWDNIQTYFPEHGTSSRILLTARLQEVASYACSSKLCYKMRFLDCDESWNLFCVKIQWCLNKDFETIGRKIVENCRGLPLTIVVLAGHLSAKMAVDEWKSVESTLNSLVNLDLYQHFSRILNLSYNNLPCHLKSCFLYLGVFPEDSEIEIKRVIRLWIAEGFIEEEETTTLERTGKKYLKDLINRSLIMISGRGSNGKVKTCKMHDLLHELCASKAKTEKLLCTRDSSGHDDKYNNLVRSDGNRWLNLTLVSQLHHLSITSKKSRSILCFDRRDRYLRVNYVKMRAECFKMVRVLDLTALDYVGSIPSDIVLLRYLALASTRLLTSIRVWRNWNLQTLIICEDISGVRKLPRGIWELPQLRHLELYHQLIPMYTPEEAQLNLQTMYWLKCLQCTEEQVLLRIPNVKELGILAQGCRCHHCFLDNLSCLNKLEKLKVQGSYCPVKLQPYTLPQSLKNITFAKTVMPWEAMNIISMLPKLEVLKLKNHACVGQEWKLTVERGFPELKLLLISVMDLKHWELADDVDDDHPFPKLERLVLRNCFELKEMPSWIENLSNLKSVQLEHCHASLVTSARMIEKEQRECCGEECAFNILEFYTQSDQNNSQGEEIKEDQKSNDAEQIDEIFDEQKNEKDIKMSVFLDARSLYIPHVNSRRYWMWTRDSGHEVAELVNVCWLEITGTVDTGCLSKITCYSAYLVFKLDPLSERLETAVACVKYLNDKGNYGENRRCQVFLEKSKYSGDPGQFPDCRPDGWMEIKLGDFYVSSGNEGEVQMRLWNTEPDWKSGLIVRGIEVRPI
ncbi:putative late blight resistance protein homolog R1B-17 isoform X2 [Ipomoea triloba]|uniref:putative late blight resistance protein homolog R1B-17 isoform X2 n=1 Tax=Ipomoea triloba TaxID=35885 RepID=UPI00125E71F4|nr:putative late blight resistance protein homolog R1B-17 isoform X2 [Ipomoea triloba]